MTRGARRVFLAGGHEPEGRAGLLADAGAVCAQGAFPVSIPTALTAQGPRTFRISAVAPAMLRASLDAAHEHGRPDAVKLGMVPGPAQWAVLRAWLRDHPPRWVVVDPVVRSARGQPLSSLTPRAYLALFGPRVVLTPNADEAAWLLGDSAPVRTVADALAAGARLCRLGPGAVVIKGGHLRGGAADVVVTPSGARVFEGRRLARSSGHRGTGCRFASALAAALAQGEALPEAVESAKGFVQKFLTRRILPGR